VVDRVVPVWGITRFSEPSCYFDRCVIAWGGVVAQAIVAVTLLIWAETSGYTRFQSLNTNLAILGFFSWSVAVFHLLPIRPLDEAIAWGLGPAPRIPQTPARQTSQTETRMAILEINLPALFPLFDTAARHRL
jgi:hypothetical protein